MAMKGRVAAGLTMLVVSGVLGGCGDVARGPTDPAPSESARLNVSVSSVIVNDRVPFAGAAFVPCANGGAGELVMLSGTLHVLIHETESPSGNIHAKSHFQPQGVSGVGVTTGDQYRATGVTQGHTNTNGPLPFTDTFINNFRIIGPGPGNNFLVHQTFHVTINANGEVTAVVTNTSIDCK